MDLDLDLDLVDGQVQVQVQVPRVFQNSGKDSFDKFLVVDRRNSSRNVDFVRFQGWRPIYLGVAKGLIIFLDQVQVQVQVLSLS